MNLALLEQLQDQLQVWFTTDATLPLISRVGVIDQFDFHAPLYFIDSVLVAVYFLGNWMRLFFHLSVRIAFVPVCHLAFLNGFPNDHKFRGFRHLLGSILPSRFPIYCTWKYPSFRVLPLTCNTILQSACWGILKIRLRLENSDGYLVAILCALGGMGVALCCAFI